jgi:hypothetical protein
MNRSLTSSLQISRRAALALTVALLGACAQMAPAPDPLPSWNEGPAKEAIVQFVRKTTDSASPQFVPPAQRVATFDQDGTLWVEQPMYAQVAFALDRVKDVVKAQPALANEEPFKAVVTGDRAAMARFTEADLLKIVGASQAGLTIEAFRDVVKAWATTAKHPLPASLHRTRVRPHGRGHEIPACQWLPHLHRHRRWAGVRARLCRRGLWRAAGALPGCPGRAIRPAGKAAGNNPAIALMTVLGHRKAPAKVTINEMTTVASVWTHNQFISGDGHPGASRCN